MILIAGLGNPGEKYVHTRHNIGFMLIDSVADALSVNLSQKGSNYTYGTGSHKGHKVILIKPETYMNHSGFAMRNAVNKFGIETGDCLICYDDINLPLGTLRIRPGGSHGGHNGLGNIIDMLETREIPRLRIGIGKDFPKGRQSDYVLSPFDRDELPAVEKILDNGTDAVLTFIRDGLDKSMNQFN